MFTLGESPLESPLGCWCWVLWGCPHWDAHTGMLMGQGFQDTDGGQQGGHGSDPTTSSPWSCTQPPAAGNLPPKSHSTTSLQLYNRKRNAHNAEGNLFQSLLHLRGEQTGWAPALPSPAVDRSCAQGRTSSLNKYLSSEGRRGARDAWGFPLFSVEFLAKTKEKG